MEITCPVSGANVLVSAANTICVRGTVSATAEPEGLPQVIRVRVVAGHITPPPPDPDPREPGDVDVSPTGSDWCAQNVPVSGSSPTGTPLTVVVWSKTGRGDWSRPQSEQFNGGGPNPTDCCTGCS